MNSKITRASAPEADALPRTDWFSFIHTPTIEGEYEARTGGGHVFRRRWCEKGWINSITGLISTAALDWRGVAPGSIPVTKYPVALRDILAQAVADGSDSTDDRGLDIPFF